MDVENALGRVQCLLHTCVHTHTPFWIAFVHCGKTSVFVLTASVLISGLIPDYANYSTESGKRREGKELWPSEMSLAVAKLADDSTCTINFEQ